MPEAAAGGTTAGHVADLYGWDTVFAAPIAQVNRAIRERGSSPEAFEQSDAADGYAVHGVFGDWQVGPGGSGAILMMEIPFRDAALRGPGSASEVLSGTARVTLHLEFVDAVEAPAGRKALRVKAAAKGGDAPAPIDHLSFDGHEPDPLVGIAFRMLLQHWLNANVATFAHVFAVIDVGDLATGAFAWLKPTAHAYAYVDQGEADGFLGIMCMTQGRPAGALPSQVSPYALRGEPTFSISGGRMLAELVMPSLPKIFDGAAASDFALSDDRRAVTLTGDDVPITLTDRKTGETHDCTLAALSIEVAAGCLKFDATTRFTHLGVHHSTRVRSEMTFVVLRGADGKPRLTYKRLGKPRVDQTTHESEALVIAEVVLTVIALVAAIAASVLTLGALGVGVALVAGLAAGVLFAGSLYEQEESPAPSPEITGLASSATAAIAWSEVGDFALTDVELNGALQLRGTL